MPEGSPPMNVGLGEVPSLPPNPTFSCTSSWHFSVCLNLDPGLHWAPTSAQKPLGSPVLRLNSAQLLGTCPRPGIWLAPVSLPALRLTVPSQTILAGAAGSLMGLFGCLSWMEEAGVQGRGTLGSLHACPLSPSLECRVGFSLPVLVLSPLHPPVPDSPLSCRHTARQRPSVQFRMPDVDAWAGLLSVSPSPGKI